MSSNSAILFGSPGVLFESPPFPHTLVTELANESVFRRQDQRHEVVVVTDPGKAIRAKQRARRLRSTPRNARPVKAGLWFDGSHRNQRHSKFRRLKSSSVCDARTSPVFRWRPIDQIHCSVSALQ